MQPAIVPETTRRSLSLVGLTLVVLSALLTSSANLLFRAAMSGTRSESFYPTIQRLLHWPPFYLGWILYGLAAVIWFRVLKTEPLSSSYPILTALTFLIVSAGATLIFREEISLMKASGMAIILFGIALVARA